MNQEIKRIISKRLENVLILILVLMTLDYPAQYYVESNILPRFFLYVFIAVPMVLLIILMIKIKVEMSTFRFFFLIILFMIMVNTFINYGEDAISRFRTPAIYSQILSAYFFSRLGIDVLYRSFKVIAVLALISLLYVFTQGNINLLSALMRTYTRAEMFYFTALFWAVIPFVILSVLKEENLKLSIAYWIGGVALSLVFLKRDILVDSMLLLISILIINSSKVRKVFSLIKIVAFIITFVSLGVYFQGDFFIKLFAGTQERIEATAEDIYGFNRLVESENYFSDATPSEIIFGKGIYGVHYGLSEHAQALHIGWANFVFKGGLILLFVILISYLKVISLITHMNKHPINIQFSLWILLIFFVRLMYGNLHNLSPEMLIFFYALFSIMDYSLHKPKRSVKIIHAQ